MNHKPLIAFIKKFYLLMILANKICALRVIRQYGRFEDGNGIGFI